MYLATCQAPLYIPFGRENILETLPLDIAGSDDTRPDLFRPNRIEITDYTLGRETSLTGRDVSQW